MEAPTEKNKRGRKPECVLKCEGATLFFNFPRDDAARRIWTERLGLDALPRNIFTAKVCDKHFSDRMVSKGGKRLTRCAVPDRNIKGQAIENTPYTDLQVIKPPPVFNYVDLAEIPRIVTKVEIITSRASRCFLKCKDAKTTFGFPQDKPSLDVWAKQMGLDEMPPRSSTARICSNHFSPRMFTSGKGVRLTRCAIPDINLPGQTVFRSEGETMADPMHNAKPKQTAELRVDDEPPKAKTIELPDTALNFLQNEQEINDLFRSVLDPSVIIAETPKTSQQEILINPIENIKNVINSTPNKEGILHVFQPGIESKAEDQLGEDHVIVPEDVIDAESECVLKCPHGERLFRFPSMEEYRQLWLKKIGLTHCYFNTRICSRHFSDRMFVSSKKRLVRFAYPDINLPAAAQPRIKDASRVLNNYRMILQDKHVCDVIELPEYICVLTVLKEHTEIGAVVNGIKYVQHKVDSNVPKRERAVQVNVSDLIQTANVAIPADDYVDDFDIVEDVDYQQLDWINMFKSHVFASNADMYECLICGEITVGYACNIKHSNVHKESSSLCFQCGRVFSSQHKLKMHEKDKHLNMLRKALRCPKMHCKKAFHSKKQLHHHVDEHTRRTEHRCNKCLRVFTSSLKLHCHQVACRNCWAPKYRKRARIGIRAKIK